MKPKIPIPGNSQKWVEEISNAYLDAYETIPFGKLTGVKLTEENLFQLAPMVCLNFRGIEQSETNIKQASDASLSSCVATKENTPEIFDAPQMSFAFCYIASHYGLNLLDADACSSILDYIERNIDSLIEDTKQG